MKKVALISAILFFLVYFATNTFLPEDETNADIRPVVDTSPSAETIPVDQAVLNPIIDADAPPVAPADADTPTEVPADADVYPEREVPPEAETGYYIIVASFSDIGQARQMADKYKGNSNTEIIILPPTLQGYYRVSYGHYATPGEAGAVLPVVKKTIDSGAWIYSVR